MNRLSLVLLSLAVALSGQAANNIFNFSSGDWNVPANWNLNSVPDTGANGDPALINQSHTAIIQSNTTAAVKRFFLGNDSTGTLEVRGSITCVYNTDGIMLGIYNSGTGSGILNVNGGTVGSPTARSQLVLGHTGTAVPSYNRGALNIYNGGSAYLSEIQTHRGTNNVGLSTISVNGGTLNVSGTLFLGYDGGVASNAQMTVSGASTVSANVLNIGRNSGDIHSSGQLTINGSAASLTFSNSFLFLNSSVINLNFDDSGISPVTAPKFWHNDAVTVNVNGTPNVAPGTYTLFTGTTGGTTNFTPTFNISGFHPDYSVQTVKETTNGVLRYTLHITQQTGHTYDFGTCEQQLIWRHLDTTNLAARLALQLEHLDAMKTAGADWVRLSLIFNKNNDANMIAHIKHCNEIGLRVLMVMESGQPALYPPGTVKRDGSEPPGAPQWPSYRLSDLDLDRAETYVNDFFTALINSNATIHAVEMFNEINWNSFNGDLPLVTGGLWIDENTPWTNSVFAQYRIGIDKIAQLTKRVSNLNDTRFGGALKIITAGQVGYYSMDSNWFASVKGGLVSQDLTLQLMHGSNPNQSGATNYLQYVDGIGMHIYPATADNNPQTSLNEIAEDLDPLLAVPGAGTTKPFWITECGYSLSKCGNNETNRFNQLSVFYNAFDQYDRPKSAVGAVFHFVFCQEAYPGHAVWDHGNFYKSSEIFQVPSAENTLWTNRLFDAWQVEHFGDAASDTRASDTADFDNDGSSNLAEYNAGSDPDNINDPGRTLRFDASAIAYIARTNDTTVTSTFLRSPSLNPTDWQPVTNALPVAGATNGFQRFTCPPEGNTAFYRLSTARISE